MQFKRSILAAAVGAALCASGPALALDPSVDGNPQLIVRLSGATAQDPIVGQAIARLCLVTAGVSTLDRYLIGTTQFGYYCSMSSATIPGLSGTLRVLVLKESVAGSGNGVTPLLAPGSTLAFEKIDTTTIGSCGATSAVGTVTVTGDPLGIPGFNSRTCSTAAVDPTPQRPIAGLSDVEPAFFTTANTTALAPTSANLLGFGVAVNEQLYRALQVAQGKDSTNTNAWPGNDPAVTGITTIPIMDSPDQMPSLSRGQISAFLSGNADWSSLRDNAGLPLTLPTDPAFYLARRGNTSGTQKTLEIWANGGSSGRCNSNAPAMPSSGNGSPAVCVTPGGVTVFEGGSTGAVRQCLQDHDTGNRWAMGIVSLEQAYATQVSQKFRYVKIDGYEPSLLNIFKGYYSLWSEQSLNKSFDFGTATWSADQRAVVNKLFTSLGDTSVIRAANGGFRQVWGAGANMTTFFNGTPFDPGATLTMANLQTNPVSAVSKTLDPTLGPDNCNPPFAFGPAQR